MTITINTYKIDVALIINKEIITRKVLKVGATERKVAIEIALLYAERAFPDEKAEEYIIEHVETLDVGIITK